MSDVDSFVSPRPPTDHLYKARVQSLAGLHLHRMLEAIDVRPQDEISLHVTVSGAAGTVVDRRIMRAPDKLER
jgi:hypothetical protein